MERGRCRPIDRLGGWMEGCERTNGTPAPAPTPQIPRTPHPNPPSQTTHAQDCRRAARALDVGELLCGPDFSLYEAMSALELMDPKMDEALQEVRKWVGWSWCGWVGDVGTR